MNAAKQDIYTRVTNRIINDLEQGVRSWMKPWNAEHAAGKITRPLRHNGAPYQGINVLLLWGECVEKEYSCPIWMTYRQAAELKAHVRKGERGATVVYADKMTRTELDKNGEEQALTIPFMKSYTVFNAEQIEGLPDHYYAKPENPLPLSARIGEAERFMANASADIRHGGSMAYYSPGSDHIQLPRFEFFRDAESYYATALHELTHWTKHTSRLDRDLGRKRFGDEGYAREELVAELGAAFLCADLSITPEPREDHAAYLDHWLKVLKEDKRAIFTAAAHAQKAADYLVALSAENAAEA